MKTTKSKKVSIKKNRCAVCNKVVVGGLFKLKSHMFLHSEVESRFKCSFCPKEFFRSDIYASHLNKHIGADSGPKKSYTCDHCDRSFVNKRNLVLHLKVHDDNLRHDYKCAACGVTYCEQRLLKYHIRKTHYNLQDGTNSVKKETNESWIEPVKQTEACVEITKINNSEILIKKCDVIKQENIKTKENTKFIEYMSSIFAQNDNSQYSKAKCDYCHKEMLKKSLLPHIRERHLKLRRFRCEVCERAFSRHYQLVDHVCGKQRKRRKVEV